MLALQRDAALLGVNHGGESGNKAVKSTLQPNVYWEPSCLEVTTQDHLNTRAAFSKLGGVKIPATSGPQYIISMPRTAEVTGDKVGVRIHVAFLLLTYPVT
jgi:hypothetical protein